MALKPDDVFHPTTLEYYDGQHYVKPCSLCGAVVPVLSEFATPDPRPPHGTLWLTGLEIHVAFHNRLPAW